MDTFPSSSPLLHWSVATHTLTGQRVSGDVYLVTSFPGGVLVAVIDGLGHGPEAVAAANLAVAALRENASDTVVALLQRCHEQLKGTRGVVMSLGSFSTRDGLMTWGGVGDVEGVLLRGAPDADPARESLPLRGGVVGYQLPVVRPTALSVKPEDMLIFATDGIRSSFVQDPVLRNPLLRLAKDGPRRLADHLLAHHGKATDDALVLVARYLGVGQ
jgi:hypothetical protein